MTSSFQSHSAMGAARVAGNISRIIAFPVIAKLSDVSKSLLRPIPSGRE